MTGPFGELLPYDHAAAEAQLLLGEAIAAALLHAHLVLCFHEAIQPKSVC